MSYAAIVNVVKRLVVLWLLSIPAVYADSNTLPAGIRIHDIGLAPDFTVQDIDGESFTFSSTRGQWVFLHFWASWCGPCREEMPELQKLSEIIPAAELRYVLVNTAEDEDTIFSFFGEVEVDMDSFIDTEGRATEMYKPRGLPTTMLIDPNGQVRYQAVGGREWSKPEYIMFLRQLLMQ